MTHFSIWWANTCYFAVHQQSFIQSCTNSGSCCVMCSKTTSLTPHRLNCRSRAAVVCGHTRRNNAVPVDFIQRRPVLHFHSGPLCPGYPLASSRLLQKQIEKVSIVVFIVGNSACGVVFIPRCSCLRFEVSVVAEQLFWVAEP